MHERHSTARHGVIGGAANAHRRRWAEDDPGRVPPPPTSVQACWKALIDAMHQPRHSFVSRPEHDPMLENMVEIDVPSAKAVESGNRSPAVDRGDELLLVRMLVNLHGLAS